MLATPFLSDQAASDWVARNRQDVDAALEALLRDGDDSPVKEAMRYSVLAPGKRMRPLLTLAVTDYLGGDSRQAMRTACALEFIHSASLILDDLPCMDNDAERRSRMSTHVRFGEGLTILAAVSLLTQSCCMIASDEALPLPLRLKLVQLLCETVGPHGLSLGQSIDLHGRNNAPSLSAITDLHHLKTGVLFLAAARSACLICNATPAQEKKVLEFSAQVGLAYQLQDDLKDINETAPNMAARIGLTSAERQLIDYLQAAHLAIAGEPRASMLQNFVRAFIKAGRSSASSLPQAMYRESRL